MKLVTPFILAALMASHGVEAWGDLAHEAIGYIAMQFLDPTTLSDVKSILGPIFHKSLGPAAIWADEQKVRKEFEFTIPFHFIRANDDPPNNCSVDSRDCSDAGCSITAIQRYTGQLLDQDLNNFKSRKKTQEALLFLTNFIGNTGQPLSNEARGQGGNEIATTCDGNNTSLHDVWDTAILTKYTNITPFKGDPQEYALRLANEIEDGEYTPKKDGWVSDINESALSGTDVPLTWAREANSLGCTVVFNFTSNQDLCKSPYFDNVIPVIHSQIAKQGYRLAIWLNTVFRVRRQNRA